MGRRQRSGGGRGRGHDGMAAPAERAAGEVTSPRSDELLELETGAIAAGGGCVAHAPDGRVVFVRHALPGEHVRARITASASSYLRADAVEILSSSPDRVEPPCAYAGPGLCGGCDFQHVELDVQRRLKAALVSEQLARLAGIEHSVEVEPVGTVAGGLDWRSRVRLGVTDTGKVGFRRHRSHQLVAVDDCPVVSPAVRATGAFTANWQGASQLEIATGGPLPHSVITVAPRSGTALRLPEVAAEVVRRDRTVRPGAALHPLVRGRKYRVSAGVFWQAHTDAAAELLDAVLSLVGVCHGEDAVDLFAGAGLFSVALAEAVGDDGSVLAIERNRQACADARFNGAGTRALEVLERDVTPELVASGIGNPDVVVLDPPREGAGIGVMAALAAHAPTLRRIVYVSCDPASYSRDIRVLLDVGWSLGSLRALDIFPMTEHVELVSALDPPPA